MKKTLMDGVHMHGDVIVPSAFVERVAQAIFARGHDMVELEAIGFVFNEGLARLFGEKHGGIGIEELVDEGLFAFELECARRAAQAAPSADGGTRH